MEGLKRKLRRYLARTVLCGSVYSQGSFRKEMNIFNFVL